VMLRSPYGTTTTRSSYFVEMAERGIAGVAQDCRGRFNSDGKFTPWVNEERDGQEMIEWLVKQPWCNGNIALEGRSYSGAT